MEEIVHLKCLINQGKCVAVFPWSWESSGSEPCPGLSDHSSLLWPISEKGKNSFHASQCGWIGILVYPKVLAGHRAFTQALDPEQYSRTQRCSYPLKLVWGPSMHWPKPDLPSMKQVPGSWGEAGEAEVRCMGKALSGSQLTLRELPCTGQTFHFLGALFYHL